MLGQILRPQPRSQPHEVWPRSHASRPHDFDNSQVDGNYELPTSFSVLSLSTEDFRTYLLCCCMTCIFEICDKLNILQIFVLKIN